MVELIEILFDPGFLSESIMFLWEEEVGFILLGLPVVGAISLLWMKAKTNHNKSDS